MYELFIIKIHNISYFGQILKFVEIVRVKENNKIPLTQFFGGYFKLTVPVLFFRRMTYDKTTLKKLSQKPHCSNRMTKD